MKIAKDLRPVAKLARRQGWTLEQRKGGHLRWQPPAGDYIVTSATPSDARAVKNARRDLRRAGLAGA